MPVGKVGVLARGRVQHIRRETPEEQCARAGRRGHDAATSAERLASVFAEEDRELERLREAESMSHYEACRHCGSKFVSDALQAHERACGELGKKKNAATAAGPAKVLRCRRCGLTYRDIAELAAHHREVHYAEVRAAQSRGMRKAKEKGRRRGAGDGGGATPEAPREERSPRPTPSTAPPPAAPPVCPTCGAAMIPTTAQLFAELKAIGFAEPAALEAIKIARRILVPGSDR